MTTVSPSRARVVAVVVTYRGEPQRLAQQFESLLPQVDLVVWVDNGSGTELREWAHRWSTARVRPLWLRHNLGLGAAQNRGMQEALSYGATHVLLMDQDSVPAPNMVQCLLDALIQRPDAAAAGPYYEDARRSKASPSPFFAVEAGRLRWKACTDLGRSWEVDHVIASGCLIPVSALRRVGWMREDFFIDWVDVEWCWRARSQGYTILGVCGARLEHCLGDRVVMVSGREIPIHAPWRHYYQARNLILMLSCSRIGWSTKLHCFYHQLRRFFIFSTLVPGRRHYFRMWIKGLWDGLTGRSGVTVLPGRV